jgi:hypothetical protein
MDDVWAKQYQAGMAEQQKRREAEDEKREDMRRVQNEVKVLFFDQVRQRILPLFSQCIDTV